MAKTFDEMGAKVKVFSRPLVEKIPHSFMLAIIYEISLGNV